MTKMKVTGSAEADVAIKHTAYLLSKEEVYSSDLRAGKVERSNLEVNKRFLRAAGVLAAGQKVLEVGCGAGSMTAYLTAQGVTVIGTDVSQVLLDHARSRHPKCTFRNMSAEELQFENGSFDAVLSFDVLEHIPEIGQHLQEVRRVLRPSGYYLLQTPNKWTNVPFSILRDRSLGKWREYHPSLQTTRSLARLVTAHGFSVRLIRMDVYNRFFRQKLVFPLNLINIDRLPIQTNLYCIARKEN